MTDSDFLHSNIIFPHQGTDFFEKSKGVHIRIKQRNARHCLTLVEGIDDPHQILKYLKKTLATNGTLFKEDTRTVIQLQGDHRQKVRDFLIVSKLFEANQIKMHGAGT